MIFMKILKNAIEIKSANLFDDMIAGLRSNEKT